METPIRILLVDDHAVVRSGLRLLLETQRDLTVVGEADSAATALALCRGLNPVIVLMDIGLPGCNGLEATRRIKDECPDIKVLILTMHEDDAYFTEALEVGACGYVLKEASPTELLAGIRAVAAGGGFFHPVLARRLAMGEGGPAAHGAVTELTDREREILCLTVKGKSNREIGETLFISPRTVERHRSNLLAKLGLNSRADLIRYAVEHGLAESKPF